jgi:hypothetical protein
MSAADAEEDDVEASEDVAEEQAEPEDDRPGIDEEETADLDAIREEVAAETAPSPTEDGEDDGDTSGDEDTAAAETDSSEPVDGEDTVGDFYVDTLVSTSNMLIEQHGREGADPIDGGFLRQMGVDDAVDEMLAENGQPDMPPEQQVLLGTCMFGVAVLATRTTIFDQALENSDLDLFN